jgi:hypothetical protein
MSTVKKDQPNTLTNEQQESQIKSNESEANEPSPKVEKVVKPDVYQPFLHEALPSTDTDVYRLCKQFGLPDMLQQWLLLSCILYRWLYSEQTDSFT